MNEIFYRVAPSRWASYLVSGDHSGLTEREKADVDQWIAREGLGLPVASEPCGFRRFASHPGDDDAHLECDEYAFLVERHATPIWRVYGASMDFGVDYSSRAEAERARDAFKHNFPDVAYRIRRIGHD